uniref:Uncharacterized protein n=1 Tax=Oryza glumipatula TaxID=40148 RepID=A0A0E0AKD6_9ORYZ
MGRGGGDGRDEELLPGRSDNLPSASFFRAREEAEPRRRPAALHLFAPATGAPTPMAGIGAPTLVWKGDDEDGDLTGRMAT